MKQRARRVFTRLAIVHAASVHAASVLAVSIDVLRERTLTLRRERNLDPQDSVGLSPPVDQGFIEMATFRKRFPTDEARERLGWELTVALDEGLRRTTRWLKEQGIV